MRRSRFVFILAMMLWAHLAHAQTVAVGPYYATPSWDQTIPCTATTNCSRFVVLSNFSNQAVLDRETGLVWEQAPTPNAGFTWTGALQVCTRKPVGGRMGWRLPTVSEIGSLFQGALVPVGGGFVSLETSLPAGHPFSVQSDTLFWTSTPGTDAGFPWAYLTEDGPNQASASDLLSIWCVRSGAGPAGS